MQKTRVCFLMYQIITGGIEKCLIRILEKLSPAEKYDFCVVSKKKVTEQYFLDFFKKHNIKLIELMGYQDIIGEKPKNIFKKIVWKQKYKNFKEESKKTLSSLIKNTDIFIDYFNGAYCNELKGIKVPKIIFYHSGIETIDKNHLSDLLLTYDRFICLTDSFYNDTKKMLPQLINKVQRIYNPIDLEKINILAKEAEYKKNEKYFVFLGRFHKDKDHLCVINAFNKFCKIYPDGKIYFIGTGEYEEQYKNKIKELNLENNILFTGILENPYGYLKNAIANILSSPSEGLSNVLIEAAALGVLNIASDCKSSPSEILLNGEAGILFKPADSEALSDILEKVWNNEIDKQKLINKANENIWRFEQSVIIKQIEELISSTITNNKGGLE